MIFDLIPTLLIKNTFSILPTIFIMIGKIGCLYEYFYVEDFCMIPWINMSFFESKGHLHINNI